jgi:hypothetical protein
MVTAALDYHMCGPLKEALHGQRSASDDEVKVMLCTWPQSKPKTFFAGGIRKLVNCYTLCIEKRG